ncbi:tyrosine-type recombinase/integrase [Oligella urethralis]|uniref:tyrosine-type recombinase/integrase n=1 Tax=Oligella urethralis TaxID=90245 RepID=UPI0024332FAD|nr:site-specific integrase [Oligella urethralis]
MLTNSKLKALKPKDKPYKEKDIDGLYAYVSTAGTITFRYDYRFNGRRKTLTIGRYGASGITLAEAREELIKAKKLLSLGKSPSEEKKNARLTRLVGFEFDRFANEYIAQADFSDSTRALRYATYEREMKKLFGNKLLSEITTDEIRRHCMKIKERGAPSTAIFVRDLFNAVYRYAKLQGVDVENPAENIANASIAKFRARSRVLTPKDIYLFFTALNKSDKYFTVKKGIYFMLYTMVRKTEFTNATWCEFDLRSAVWTIPVERMKARRQHNVYLSNQVMEILTGFKMFCDDSKFIAPSRGNKLRPVHGSSLNRAVSETIAEVNKDGEDLEFFTPHDFRRTASTILNEKGYNTDWIEKCLAHEQIGVRAVYNKAEYAEQRRIMMQDWADMVDHWIAGNDI